MQIWKLIILVIVVILFNTCHYFGIVNNDLENAWAEVNQEKDIFAYSEQMKEEAFNKFTEGYPEDELKLLDIKISQEEKRILKVQSLIENAHSEEISLLLK